MKKSKIGRSQLFCFHQNISRALRETPLWPNRTPCSVFLSLPAATPFSPPTLLRLRCACTSSALASAHAIVKHCCCISISKSIADYCMWEFYEHKWIVEDRSCLFATESSSV